MQKRARDLVAGDHVTATTGSGKFYEAVVVRAYQSHSTPIKNDAGFEAIAWIIVMKFPRSKSPNLSHHIFIHPDDLVRVA